MSFEHVVVVGCIGWAHVEKRQVVVPRRLGCGVVPSE